MYDSEVNNTSPIRFAAACGAVSSLDLVIEKGNGEVVTSGAIDQPCAMIGRDQYCEIVLSDPTVSARHTFLQIIGGRVFVVDLDSRAGTRWDDQPRPDGWLAPDAPIQLGRFRIHLVAPVSETPTRFGPSFHPLQVGQLPPHYPRAVIEFHNGKVAQSRWEINRTLTLIGRARSCKINLASEEVSLFHAYFLLTPDGVWVVDLFGRGGVLVNGEPVRYSRLDHGDEVRIAKFVFGLAYEEGAKPSLPMRTPLGTAFSDVPSGFPDLLAGLETAPPVTLVPAGPELAGQDFANQVATAQNQIFDQFQQSMLMMMKMFGQAQQQQIAAMKQEMAKLAALTEEMQKLQTQAGSQPQRSDMPFPGRLPNPDNTPVPTEESAKQLGLVFERIAALNSERQGVWQRLMRVVSAKPAGG